MDEIHLINFQRLKIDSLLSQKSLPYHAFSIPKDQIHRTIRMQIRLL